MFFIVEIARSQAPGSVADEGLPPEQLPDRYGTKHEAEQAGAARVDALLQENGWQPGSVIYAVLDEHGKPVS